MHASMLAKRARAPRRRPSASADPPPRPTVFDRLAARLDRARTADDWPAYETVWAEQWSVLYTTAVTFCARMGCDAATARQRAADALGAAWLEMGAILAESAGPRPGDAEFLNRLTARVVLRCKDGRRAAAAFERRFLVDSAPEDGGADPLEARVGIPPSQEDDLLRGERSREAVDTMVADLTEMRERCLSRPALLALIDAMLAYVRHCVLQAAGDGAGAEGLSLDELVERAVPSEVEATKSAMNQFVMERLGLNRTQLDTRMADLRGYPDGGYPDGRKRVK
jgi:hypothetical protein